MESLTYKTIDSHVATMKSNDQSPDYKPVIKIFPQLGLFNTGADNKPQANTYTTSSGRELQIGGA